MNKRKFNARLNKVFNVQRAKAKNEDWEVICFLFLWKHDESPKESIIVGWAEKENKNVGSGGEAWNLAKDGFDYLYSCERAMMDGIWRSYLSKVWDLEPKFNMGDLVYRMDREDKEIAQIVWICDEGYQIRYRLSSDPRCLVDEKVLHNYK